MKKGELLGLILEHEASKWASTQISPFPPIHGNASPHGPRYRFKQPIYFQKSRLTQELLLGFLPFEHNSGPHLFFAAQR